MDPSSRSSSRYALGIVFILLQCIVWIGAAVITSRLGDQADAVPPFLLTYIGMSLMGVLLLPVLLQLTRDSLQSEGASSDSSCPSSCSIQEAPSMDTLDVQLACAQHCSDYADLALASEQQLANDHTREWKHRRHLRAALFLTPSMFAADYFFNQALYHTSVASTTVLVSTQSVFVFLLALWWSMERFSVGKLVGVLMGIAGTTMMVGDDFLSESTNQGVLLGDLCAVVAAIFYAIYTVQVGKYCPENEDLYSTRLLLGYIGATCALLLAPLALYVAVLASVDWSWPLVAIVCAKGLLDFLVTDYCTLRAIVLTNPTLATVGLSLTIPMAYGTDWAMGRQGRISWLETAGALAILISFLLVNLAPHQKPTSTNKNLEDPLSVKTEQVV